ncbi:ABC transporter ATP-binding protein [Salinicoccus sp. YB14-2]|uniref:ABC transporter ATP-binding protein n=1 Tax=Salinicoccus sp. YB14-2 TaxID=1572701 RepID=UPI00068C2A7F|nr:ABC transporter ATP-binding protein [Salinicoccus sp. YB14-2]
MNYKVKVKNVYKSFDLNRNRIDKLLSLFSLGSIKKEKKFYALNDISFEVNEGDSVGIIGLNGSGKSTLTDLLAEVTQPSSGTIDINGEVSLIAIGAGLEQELTGIENIRLKCLMHGLTDKKIDAIFDDIVEFSELGDFIHQPIRTYSSGMKSRLGFSIAINTDPDILIVDEALSVGDKTFSQKCLVKIKEFQEQNKTIFFVSHSGGQIKDMCNKAAWVQFGKLERFGEVEPILEEYESFIENFNMLSKDEQMQYREKLMETQRKEPNIELKKDENVKISTIITTFLLFLMFAGSAVIHTLNILGS